MLPISVNDTRYDLMAGASQRHLAQLVVVWMLLCALVLVSGHVSASTEVGAVVFAKGAVSARDESGTIRLLGRDSTVFQNDTVATAAESFAVIRFVDETKMSIRPNSEVVIDKFNATEGEEAAEFNLIKGGLRAITGAIGTRNPESVRFKTRAASIGIRGTDLVIRDCLGDACQLEELELSHFEPVKTECAVPMVVDLPGVYYAVLVGTIFSDQGGKQIELKAPAAGYANEQEMTCLGGIPRFILHDKYLNKIDLNGEEFELFDILGIDDDEYPACQIL